MEVDDPNPSEKDSSPTPSSNPSSQRRATVAASRNTATKLQAKLRRAVDDKNFYEAHQIYRTIYARSGSKEKLDDILTTLRQGALLLLTNDQVRNAPNLLKLHV